MTAPSTTSSKGDDTLVGTQLQLIDQLKRGVRSWSLQITSAIGLTPSEATAFQDAVHRGDSAAAVEVLRGAANGDTQFLATLEAIEDTLFGAVQQTRGKDGLPNRNLIVDFRPANPTTTFQIHTLLSVRDAVGADAFRQAFDGRSRSPRDIGDLIVEHCGTIQDPVHLGGMLDAVLS